MDGTLVAANLWRMDGWMDAGAHDLDDLVTGWLDGLMA